MNRQNPFVRFLILTFLFFDFAGYVANAQDSLVGGTLTEDQIWTKDYTYIVYKDLRIPEGITLTIQPGVTVKVNQGRGIYVLGGNLTVDGQADDVIDSVFFKANYVNRIRGWKWKGISLTGVSNADLDRFSFANISDAEIAIDMYGCDQIRIENCRLMNNQNIAIRIFNSKLCQITDCLIQNNYDGIELVAADANVISGIHIKNCVLKNTNHNIYLLNAFGGVFIDNIIESNLIEGGNNGIWADNGGGNAFGKNYIFKNIIINIGYDAGYGLLIAQDSIDVENNIFWGNRIATYFDPFAKGSIVKNNSFYQNEKSIILSTGSVDNQFLNNTYVLNSASVFNMNETEGVIFANSNIFTASGQQNIVLNNTPQDIDFTLNYWNNSNDAAIDEMIWDYSDNPDLGVVSYIPMLPTADTASPVSPPFKVIKQLVDNQVKLTWSMNPESDLRGYKIYYGNFYNYSFPNSVEANKDTVFYLSGIDINTPIAVTTLDDVILSSETQVMGHESPFSFSTVFPFAGRDDIMCKIQNGFQTAESTIPYEYQSINWTSSGDGTFNNPGFLHPVYFPGLLDKLNGEVELTMSVTKDGAELFDSMILYIYDDPVVFAGNDTVIIADSQLELLTATAKYNESTLWVSLGDGSFDNDTLLHPFYSPGLNDISSGEVDLVLIGQSECGIAYDTLRLFLEPFFSVEGNLWFDGQLIHDGIILAVKDGTDGARATAFTHAGNDGFFRFDQLMEGNYYLYAVPDTLLINGSVPGYYANNLRWQEAYIFTLDANTYDVDITLPAVDFKLPPGEGSISGNFETPPNSLFNNNIFCNSWFEIENALDYCDGGLSNMTVFLNNSNGTTLFDFTLTDEKGNFYFNNLPYGNYILDAEKTGYQTTASSLITISPVHQHETGVILKLNTEKIGIYRTDTYFVSSLLDAYPNPTRNNLIIPFTDNFIGPAIISVYNSVGQLVMKIELTPEYETGQSSITLNVSKLRDGIYYGKIETNNTNANFTFVKN